VKTWQLNVGLAWVCLLALAQGVAIAGELVQLKESFDSDPGWEGVKNRMEAIECPVVNQDFGWNPTSSASERRGELGGVIRTSTTPAWYALPLGQSLSLKEPFPRGGRKYE